MNTSNIRLAPLALAWLLVGLSPDTLAQGAGAAGAADLLVDLGRESTVRENPEPGVARSRLVGVNTAVLDLLSPGAAVRLSLFQGVSYVARIDESEKHFAGHWTWRGRLQDDVGSHFTLVRVEDVVLGNIHPSHGNPYELRFSGTGLHVAREVVPQPNARCGVGPEHARQSEDESQAPPQEGAPIIDVLFVYTPGAETAAGGADAIRAVIRLSVSTTNTAYSNSMIPGRVRLAGMMETAYDEAAATHQQHLDRITLPDDGLMDDVHEARDDAGADLVALIVNDTDPTTGGGATFGVAHIAGGLNDDDRGFSTSDQAAAASALNWTVAHELGHNMGLAHDAGQPDFAFLPYAIGHAFTGDSAVDFQTIMARRALGGIRIQYFSNPSVTFDDLDLDGAPTTGIALGLPNEAHCAAALALTQMNVSTWRPALPDQTWVDFAWLGLEFGTEAFPFNTLGEGVENVVWGGTVKIKTGSTSETNTLGSGDDKPVTLVSDGGTAVIGN